MCSCTPEPNVHLSNFWEGLLFMQVGFCQDEIKGRQLLHNNQPIMIKGVNRHMHEDRRGKAVTEESMLADIKLLKQFNFNAVRNAHYPNNNRW